MKGEVFRGPVLPGLVDIQDALGHPAHVGYLLRRTQAVSVEMSSFLASQNCQMLTGMDHYLNYPMFTELTEIFAKSRLLSSNNFKMIKIIRLLSGFSDQQS